MTQTRWQRLQDLVDTALSLPREERAAFLHKAGDGDPDLRRQVEELVRSVEQSGNFLENAVAHCAQEILDKESDWPSSGGADPAASKEWDEGRFPPGTLLGQRYRIVSLLGRGGMGEVYRANDLMLGQAVALKFLSPEWSGAAALARFRNEVRTARQISHANVCRVYDIGEANGSTFLSMEYVDGEDLASLLRRIGRLPPDKALTLAHQLCAGVAAAHEKGVLHRDLKPANLMLDGKGQLRITDFGLAALVDQVKDIGSGTPGYMAPEQSCGRAVTVQSDIYALGVLLLELFTGKRDPTAAALTGVEPEVVEVIGRCLAEDPAKRPISAIAVSASLPGGSPLARALAAGETPSPEVVAAAGSENRISVGTIRVCVGLIVLGLPLVAWLGGKTNLLAKFTQSPPILEQKARDLIQKLGHTEPAADRAYGFLYAPKEKRNAAHGGRKDAIGGPRPLIYFWYRQSPKYLEAMPTDDEFSAVSSVSPTNPPSSQPGMIGLNLDAQGRLIELRAIPPALEESKFPVAAVPADWNLLLSAAGVDMSRFSPAEPLRVPPVGADTRAAWTGAYADAPGVPIRIEAASWHGRPVFFELTTPWSKPEDSKALGSVERNILELVFVILMLVVASFPAWRNIRSGRGDLQGAARLATFGLFMGILLWLCGESHVPTAHEVGSLIEGLAAALWYAAAVWIFYVALEPYVRRRWPQILIGWTRLLRSGIQDRLAAGHLLIGAAFGVVFTAQTFCLRFLMERSGRVPKPLRLESLLDFRHMAVVAIDGLRYAVFLTVVLLLLLTLLRALFRKLWLAAAAFILLATFLQSGFGEMPEAGWLPRMNVLLLAGLIAVVLIRFGMVALMAALAVFQLLRSFPLTADFSAWYIDSSLFGAGIVLMASMYASYIALAGRPLMKPLLLESD